jgi:hypothetical protein
MITHIVYLFKINPTTLHRMDFVPVVPPVIYVITGYQNLTSDLGPFGMVPKSIAGFIYPLVTNDFAP